MNRLGRSGESLFGPRRRTRWSQGFFFWAALLVIAGIFVFWFAKDVVSFYAALYNARRSIDRQEFADARNAFERAWRIRPNHPYVYDGAGLLFMREQAPGWQEHARKNYEEAVGRGLRSNPLINHIKEARRYLDAGRYDQAEIELEHALQLFPLNADANLLQGFLYFARSRLDKSIDQFQKAAALSPRSKEIQAALQRAREAKSRGSIPYFLDRHGQILAASDAVTGLPIYPCDFWTAHMIGYRSARRGKAGLEESLAQYIKGNTVTLTLDAGLQRIAETELGWQKGAIVVLKPQTGEILAAVSHPTYRPSQIDSSWWDIKANANNPLKNRAFESLYEPGSIVKIISAAAIIETKTDVSKLYPFRCRGYITLKGETFWDWMAHRQVDTFAEAFNQSCNVAYGRMAPLIGAATLTQYLRSFGFGEHDRINLPLPVAPSRMPSRIDSPYELAQTFIGLGKDFKITPLHGAMIAAAVANGGVMMSPSLVKEIRSVTGKVIASSPTKVYKISAKKDTAAALTKHMMEFVKSGIGNKARLIRYNVAGKTGTSGSSEDGLHGWFICFAPAERPELAVAVLCENGGKGHGIAAPRAANLLRKALK